MKQIISIFSICIFSTLLVSCSSYSRNLRDAKILGRFKIEYSKDKTLSMDSVVLQIELYDVEDNSPVDFYKPQFKLNEHADKTIVGNTCIAYFKRQDLPRTINLELPYLKKRPVWWRIDINKLKRKNKVLVKVYLAPDTRPIL